MGTSILACPGVMENGMTDGMVGAGFIHPPPVATVSPPPSLGAVPVEVDG